MRYAGIIYNDTAAAPGLCLSFYTQGCPIHCNGCHNPQTWDEDGGYEFTQETLANIISGIQKNGIIRSFAVLGGEPLSPHNLFLTNLVITTVRENYPDIPIWIWSGYEIQDILENTTNAHMRSILQKTDVIIAGPYRENRRDISMPYRGSTNQKIIIIDTKKNICYNKENEKEEYELNV